MSASTMKLSIGVGIRVEKTRSFRTELPSAAVVSTALRAPPVVWSATHDVSVTARVSPACTVRQRTRHPPTPGLTLAVSRLTSETRISGPTFVLTSGIAYSSASAVAPDAKVESGRRVTRNSRSSLCRPPSEATTRTVPSRRVVARMVPLESTTTPVSSVKNRNGASVISRPAASYA